MNSNPNDETTTRQTLRITIDTLRLALEQCKREETEEELHKIMNDLGRLETRIRITDFKEMN